MTNQHGSGNFADDPKKASEAGRKGGQHSQQGSNSGTSDKSGSHSGQQEQANRSTGQQGADVRSNQQQGSGNTFKDDPDKAREAGRKGGQHSHDGNK